MLRPCFECGNLVMGRNWPLCDVCQSFVGVPDLSLGEARAIAHKASVALVWCAWCNTYMTWRRGEGISHGICTTCKDKALNEIDKSAK